MEGIEFQILFRYLNRTESSLVIPKIVKDEVLARYRDRIQKQQQKLVNALSALRGLCFRVQLPNFPIIEIESEVAALQAILLNPQLVDILEISGNKESPRRWQNVSSVSTGDYSAISVHELVRRATYRVKPANDEGEEFRDVILWLMALSYAKEKGREVALITNDDHFYESKDSRVLHPQLKDELTREEVVLRVYSSIGEFLKADISSKPIDEAWVDRYLGVERAKEIESLLEEAVASYLDMGWRSRSEVTSLGKTVLEFKRGKLYSLGPESQYAELQYEGRAMFAIGPYVFTKAPPFNPKDYSLENVTVSADFVISVWIVAGRIAGIGLAKATLNRQ